VSHKSSHSLAAPDLTAPQNPSAEMLISIGSLNDNDEFELDEALLHLPDGNEPFTR
jgi:hypothetical protein